MFLPEPHLSGSENHHFWGDINHWFLRQLVGINVNPGEDNPNRILVRPNFVEALDHAKGSYDAVGGTVRVAWNRTEDSDDIQLKVEADEGLTCDLELPAGFYFKDSGRTYLSGAQAFADGRTAELTIVNKR